MDWFYFAFHSHFFAIFQFRVMHLRIKLTKCVWKSGQMQETFFATSVDSFFFVFSQNRNSIINAVFFAFFFVSFFARIFVFFSAGCATRALNSNMCTLVCFIWSILLVCFFFFSMAISFLIVSFRSQWIYRSTDIHFAEITQKTHREHT